MLIPSNYIFFFKYCNYIKRIFVLIYYICQYQKVIIFKIYFKYYIYMIKILNSIIFQEFILK